MTVFDWFTLAVLILLFSFLIGTILTLSNLWDMFFALKSEHELLQNQVDNFIEANYGSTDKYESKET